MVAVRIATLDGVAPRATRDVDLRCSWVRLNLNGHAVPGVVGHVLILRALKVVGLEEILKLGHFGGRVSFQSVGQVEESRLYVVRLVYMRLRYGGPSTSRSSGGEKTLRSQVGLYVVAGWAFCLLTKDSGRRARGNK